MLFGSIGFEKYQTEVKDIDGQPCLRFVFDGLPSLLHAGRPMYVPHNDNGPFGGIRQDGIEVIQGRVLPVVAVEVGEVDAAEILQCTLQSVFKTSGDHLCVDGEFRQMVSGSFGELRVCFDGYAPEAILCRCEVSRGQPEVGAEFQDIGQIEVVDESLQECGARRSMGVGSDLSF